MDLKLQLIIIITLIITIVIIINMIRKRALELRYALAWIIVVIAIMILAVFPSVIKKAAELMGVFSAMNMLFFAGFCFSLLLIFILTVTVSKITVQIKNLTQQMALMEKRLKEAGKHDEK